MFYSIYLLFGIDQTSDPHPPHPFIVSISHSHFCQSGNSFRGMLMLWSGEWAGLTVGVLFTSILTRVTDCVWTPNKLGANTSTEIHGKSCKFAWSAVSAEIILRKNGKPTTRNATLMLTGCGSDYTRHAQTEFKIILMDGCSDSLNPSTLFSCDRIHFGATLTSLEHDERRLWRCRRRHWQRHHLFIGSLNRSVYTCIFCAFYCAPAKMISTHTGRSP